MSIEREIWKPVVGFEDLYQISNFGNLKSNDRMIFYSNGKKEYRKGRIRKANIIQGYRYFLMTKSTGEKRVNMKASRMVAMAFIPNPENKPCVDHIDTNKQNDFVENLRWVTYSENNRNPITMTKYRKPGQYTHSDKTRKKIGNFFRGKKLSTDRIAKMSEKAKPILMFSKNGELITEFRSVSIAQQELGICKTHISSSCIGKRKCAGGFMWRYKNDWDGNPLEPFKINRPSHKVKRNFSQAWHEKMKTNKEKYRKTVYVYDKNGNFVSQFQSVIEAAKEFNTYSSSVCRACNGKIKYSKGYIFSYDRR